MSLTAGILLTYSEKVSQLRPNIYISYGCYS